MLEQGNFAQTSTDASAATFGPTLAIDRTYDADLAQAEATTGKAERLRLWMELQRRSSLSFGATAGDIYTVKSGFNTPDGVAVDAGGNVYIANSASSQIEEIAATTHTQWGIAMTGGSEYVIAGSAAGTPGSLEMAAHPRRRCLTLPSLSPWIQPGISTFRTSGTTESEKSPLARARSGHFDDGRGHLHSRRYWDGGMRSCGRRWCHISVNCSWQCRLRLGRRHVHL